MIARFYSNSYVLRCPTVRVHIRDGNINNIKGHPTSSNFQTVFLTDSQLALPFIINPCLNHLRSSLISFFQTYFIIRYLLVWLSDVC